MRLIITEILLPFSVVALLLTSCESAEYHQNNADYFQFNYYTSTGDTGEFVVGDNFEIDYYASGGESILIEIGNGQPNYHVSLTLYNYSQNQNEYQSTSGQIHAGINDVTYPPIHTTNSGSNFTFNFSAHEPILIWTADSIGFLKSAGTFNGVLFDASGSFSMNIYNGQFLNESVH